MELTVNILNYYIPYRVAFIFELSVFLLIMLLAGWEDYKYRSLSGELCLAILVLFGVDSIMYHNITGIIATAASALMIYLPYSFKCFGDADYLIFTAYFVLFTKPVSNLMVIGTAAIAMGLSYTVILAVVAARAKKRGDSFADEYVRAFTGAPLWIGQMLVLVLVFPQLTSL